MTTIDESAVGIRDALNNHPDYMLPRMLFVDDETHLILIGPHGQTGWCWCQATMEDCPNKVGGETHQHPSHRERPN